MGVQEVRWGRGNAYYHSDQNLLSSRLLFKNVKIEYSKLQFFMWFCAGVKIGL
jgi:hypothetical protein